MKNKIDLVILVGGKGLRIKKYLKKKPKPLVTISKFYFLDLLLRNYCKYDFNKIYLLAGYRGEAIKKRYNNKKINFVPIKCYVEKKPLGTAGSLHILKNKIQNDFILANGDTFVDINLQNVINYKLANNKCLLTLVKNKNYKSNKKLINLDIYKKKIIHKKKSQFINSGIYKFNKFFLKNIKKKFLSLENEVLPNLIKKKIVCGIKINDFFLDIGTPKNLIYAKKNLIQFLHKPALFLDRDGTINEDKGYTHKINDLRFKKNVIKGLKYIIKKKIYIFIITNQSGIARGYFSYSDFESFQKKIKTDFSKQNIFINDVQFSPYHPKAKIKKFRKRSLCRKPGNKMILNILKNWPVDIKNSAMIGDSQVDEECAIKSKLKFSLTGVGFHKICAKLFP